MKVRVFFVFLSFFAATLSFAAEAPNKRIFIEGTAQIQSQREYFIDNFKLEAVSLGYTLADNRADAGYIYRFNVTRNVITYDDGTTEPAPPEEPQFVIEITFLNNIDNTELVTFNHLFTDLDEMSLYNQFLLFRAFVYIPVDPPVEVPVVVTQEAPRPAADPTEDYWRDKWLYLRLSADFPVTFYQLQPTGLLDGVAIYTGKIDKNNTPDWVAPVENKASAMPGVTLGLEVQFLSLANLGIGLSLEPQLQIRLEHLNDTDFIMASAAANLKIPLKFIKNVMIEPYGAFVYPLTSLPFSATILKFTTDSSTIFDSFPLFAAGGGIQLGIKGGKSGAMFFDVNYMYYMGKAGVYNQIAASNPDVIYFQRTVIGLGIGYKLGFINRK